MVIAHHVILTGYGHWLPNDPRGSMSLATYCPRLAQLAEAHFGRKARQPSPAELRAFYRRANPMLHFDVLWFDGAERQAISEALGETARQHRLTCYACAVLTNHVHLLVRKHRLSGEAMSRLFKDASRGRLIERALAPPEHPVFSADACDFYKSDPESVRRCVRYIEGNFRKHNLLMTRYGFVVPYDGWPFHKRGG